MSIPNSKMSIEERKAELVEWMIILLFSGTQLSEKERDGICSWLADEQHAKLRDEAMHRYFSSRNVAVGRTESEYAEIMWPKIAQELGMNPDLDYYRSMRIVCPQSKPANRLPLAWVAARAAAVLLPAAVILGGYFWYERGTGGSQEGVNGGAVPAVPFIAEHIIVPRQDSLQHIVLADGTEVTLNRNSSFAYNNYREAELSGEAYFKVAKDPEHPFIIHSDRLTVKVLGTEFNLNAGEGMSDIALYEGVVELEYSAGTHRLAEAGMEFTLDHATDKADIHRFDTDVQPDWLDAEESLKIYTLGEILHYIEEVYGVQFENLHTIDTTHRYSFSLVAEEQLAKVLSNLRTASGEEFNFKIDGTIILLSPNE